MTTPWQAGSFKSHRPQLLFGRMYEDSAIELQVFSPRSRVFCIASAGCTARALAAAGHVVTAVDINPHQFQYAQSRAGGGPVCDGAAERAISRVRSLLSLVGWTRQKVDAFLHLEDPAEQVDYWDQILDSSLWRALVDPLLSPWLLRLFYARPFVQFVERGFGQHIRTRLRRCWANHPNRSNPYAWSLLLGVQGGDSGPGAHPIRFVCADAASFLETCSPGSFDGFSLSNIEDGAPRGYIQRLHAAVRRAAAPGAVTITRTLAEPLAVTDRNWAARDRSFLWGSVDVFPLSGD
jgi:hypothetical protein